MYLVIHSLLGLFFSFLFFMSGFLGCYTAANISDQTEAGPLGKHVKILWDNHLSSHNYISTSLLNINGWMIEVCETVHRHTHTHSWIYAKVQTTWFFMHIALFFFQVLPCACRNWTNSGFKRTSLIYTADKCIVFLSFFSWKYIYI
jgi:hypothetical protein